MATVEALKTYAEETLGLKVPPRSTKADIQAMIDGDNNGSEAAAKKPVTNLVFKKGDKKVKIILHSQDDSDRPIQASVNGYTYLIKPDEPVEIPDYVAAMLETRIETKLNPKTGKSSDVLRYPLTRL